KLSSRKRGRRGVAMEYVEADDHGVAVGAGRGKRRFAIAEDWSWWSRRGTCHGLNLLGIRKLLALFFPKLLKLQADLMLINRQQKCQVKPGPAVEKPKLKNVHGKKSHEPSRWNAMPQFVLDPSPALNRPAPKAKGYGSGG